MPGKKRHPLALRMGRRIVEFRKARGWNQTELGRRCGIGQKRVSDLERGVKAAQIDTVAKVAGALQVDPFELMLPDRGEPIPDTALEARRIESLLKRCDDRARRHLWRVMQSFAQYRTTPKN